MNKEKLWPRVFCKVTKRNVNPTLGEWQEQEHFTSMWLELPFHVSHSGDPTAINQWVGEEFSWSFLALNNTLIACHTQDHVDDLLEQV